MGVLPTVVLDPHLLISMSVTLSIGTLSECRGARFAISDHVSPTDFLPDEYMRLKQAIERQQVVTLSIGAIDMADLLPMRSVLALNQVASLAVARYHNGVLASDCGIFQRRAKKVLKQDRVLCGTDVCHRYCLN